MTGYHFASLVVGIGLAIASVSVCAAVDGPDRQTTDDLRLIQGLRERRLFFHAQQYCQQQLELAGADSTAQIDFSVELIRIQSDEGLFSEGEDRWQKLAAAAALARELSSLRVGHPRRVLIDIQQALTLLAIAELKQRQFRMALDSSIRASALDASQRARAVLLSAQREVSQRLVDARQSQVVAKADLTVDHCLNLQRNIGLQLARCGFIRASLYRNDDQLNRVSALNDVAAQLSELQKLNSPGESLWWETQVAMIECYRLLDRFDDAGSLLDRMDDDELDATRATWIAEILVQKLELAIARSNAAAAQKTLLVAQRITSTTPELDLAITRCLLWLARQGADADTQREQLNNAERIVERMGQTHGPWWQQQGQQLLLASVPVDSADGQVGSQTAWRPRYDLSWRLGNEAKQAGRHQEAIAAFDKSIEVARAAGQSDRWVASAVKAAESFEALGQHLEAANRLGNLALQHVNSDVAPSIHLRACWNLLRAVKATAEEATAGEARLADLLQQHVTTFPDTSTVDQARFWLGQHRYRQQSWSSAADNLFRVRPASSLRFEACQLAVRAVGHLVASVESNVRRRTTIQQWFDRVSDGDLQQPDAASRLAVAELALRYADELAWRREESIAQWLDQLANQVRSEVHPESVSHITSALKLPVMFLEAEDVGGLASTRDWLKSNPQKAALEKCASIFKSIESRVPAQQLKDYQIARLACLDALLKRGDSNAYWLREQAAVLGSHGDFTKAVKILKQLVEQFPNQASLRTQLARFQMQADGEDDPLNNLQTWRSLASRLKPGSADWFEAKYYVAKLLFETGQKAKSRQLLDYLAALPGGWSESGFADQFEELSDSLENDGG